LSLFGGEDFDGECIGLYGGYQRFEGKYHFYLWGYPKCLLSLLRKHAFKTKKVIICANLKRSDIYPRAP
jgi:hypothetical protein